MAGKGKLNDAIAPSDPPPRFTLKPRPFVNLCVVVHKNQYEGSWSGVLHHGVDVLLSLGEPIVSKRIKLEDNRGEGENRRVSRRRCVISVLTFKMCSGGAQVRIFKGGTC